MNFAEGLRQENIDEGILSPLERRLFDAVSLHEYKKGRAKRGLPPLTKFQEASLSAERIADMIFAPKERRKRKNPQTFKPPNSL